MQRTWANTFWNQKNVMCGLTVKIVMNILLGKVHTSLPLILTDIIEFEEVVNGRKSRFWPPKSNKYGSISNKIITSTITTNGEKTVTETSTSPRYYNCNDMGHISRDCRKSWRPFKCTECGAERHTKKYCKKTGQPTTSVSFINTLPKMSKYIEEIEINEPSPTIYGFIDTGICLIKYSVAENINLTIRPASK